MVDGVEARDDADLPGQFSNFGWLRDVSSVGVAKVEERFRKFVVIRGPNPCKDQIGIRSKRNRRLAGAELMSKVLRHQAVLIRAERMRRHTSWAVFSISSRAFSGSHGPTFLRQLLRPQ